MNEESKLIELFKKYPGIAARIRRSFAYHYDQIQREIEAEVATINKDDAARIISTRKNMPRKSNITLTFSKNQKLFTLSLKILSTFSNPLSNEN